MSLDRRALLRHAAGLGAAALIPSPLLGLARCSVRRDAPSWLSRAISASSASA
jgi:hypothetical protein